MAYRRNPPHLRPCLGRNPVFVLVRGIGGWCNVNAVCLTADQVVRSCPKAAHEV